MKFEMMIVIFQISTDKRRYNKMWEFGQKVRKVLYALIWG